MQFTERCKKIPWIEIGKGLGALFSLSIIAFTPAMLIHIRIMNMSALPTHYASVTVTEQRFEPSFIPLLAPHEAYVFVKGEDLPLKGASLNVSLEQYASLSVGDKICMSYKRVSDTDPQTYMDIAPLEFCNK